MMSKRGLNILIVSLGLCTNLYGLYGVQFGLPISGYGGHFQFLTIVGLLVATLSSIVRLINLLTCRFTALYESLCAIATPVEGLISALYWPIILYDKHLLVPEDSLFDLPLRLDVSLHLIPTIVCWIDLMVFNTKFKSSKLHIISMYVFTLAYYVWVNICFQHNGFWPYPLLAKFKSDKQRGIFFIFCGWLGSVLYRLVAKGHSLLHHRKQKQM